MFGTVELFSDPLTNRVTANPVSNSHNEEEFYRSRGAHLGQENVQIGMQRSLQKFADAKRLFSAYLVGKPASLRTYLRDYEGEGSLRPAFLSQGRGDQGG